MNQNEKFDTQASAARDPTTDTRRQRYEALRIVGLYVVFAALWILLSDRLLLKLFPGDDALDQWETIKGWSFVAVTGALLYKLIKQRITLLLAAQQARLQSDRQFGETFEQAAVGMAHIGIDDHWLLVNDKLCRILGYSAEELRQLTLRDVTHPEDISACERNCQLLRAGAVDTYTADERYLRKDGTALWVELTLSLHRDATGAPRYLIAVIQDIDARKTAESLARQSSSALDAALLQLVSTLAAAVGKRDPYTAVHQTRSAQLAAAIAARMGLDQHAIDGVQIGAQLHDLGNIYVPADILNRPGPLTPSEYALVQTHPAMGYDIVKETQLPWPIQAMLLQHHERLDGSGYPNGLSGDAICLEARIIAVAEVAEAMTAHRPYRAAHSIDEALEELRQGRGIRYDAAAVDACTTLIKEHGLPWAAH